MSLTAIDCVRRGLQSLWANWELVIVQFVQALLVMVLTLVGLVPLALVIGVSSMRHFLVGQEWADPQNWPLDAGAGWLSANLGPLTLALVALLFAWTVATLVYCYLQGGIWGTLGAADRRAAAGSTGAVFRRFSVGELKRWGAAYVWRYVWLLTILMTVWMVALLVVLLLLVVVAVALGDGSLAPLLGLGCIGAPLLLAGGFGLALWSYVAPALATREESGAWASAKGAFGVLVRRPGPVLLILLLVLAASTVLAVIVVPLQLALEVALPNSWQALLAGQVVAALIQSLVGAVLSVAAAASLIAVVNDDIGRRQAG